MSSLKKVFATVTVVTMLGVAAVPAPASAVTAAELQAQIDALLAQIATLQSQLAQVEGTSTPTGTIAGIPSGYTWDRNLTVGSTGNDVKYLQTYLNSDSDTKLADTGAGSPGNETSFFGPITRSGVIKFQDKYASDVLTPVGLTAGTGFFGPSTRSKINSLYGATVVSPPPAQEEEEEEETTAVEEETSTDAIVDLSGNVLDIRIASDTPAGDTIPDAANANFTKIILTTGEENVTVSKIFVGVKGLIDADSDLENVKVVDANGVNKGSVASFNVNNKATVTFTPNLKLSANTSTSFFLRGGIKDGEPAGLTVRLGIEENSDIVSSAGTVQGAPVYGNTFDTVSLNIGSANVDEDGTTVDSQPDVGDTGVIANKFKVKAGSTEGITIHQITAEETGTASLDDTENIELWDVTNNKSLGTVANWSGGGKASWTNLDLVVDKGNTQRFRIQLDIADGTGLTVNADVIDGSDVEVDVTGNTYGFFITPTIDNSWNGKGSNPQTIQSGSLNISKSPDTPATGNIAAADEQVLGRFDYTVLGEEMRVTQTDLSFTVSGGVTCSSEVTSVALYGPDGNIVAGPKDCDSSDEVSFTDTYIVPLGTITYTVKADISTDTSDGDTVKVSLKAPNSTSNFDVEGMTSGSTIVPTPSSAVATNTMTVNAGALAATTLTEPVAKNIAVGVTDFIWMMGSLDAAGSGEDVQVTSMQIEINIPSGNGTPADLDNMEVWADLTSANSDRGDAYETKISKTQQPATTDGSDEVETFTLTQTVTVPKDGFVKIAIVADLSTDSNADEKYRVRFDTDSNDITASGADTGNTVTLTADSGSAAGQTMTAKGAGTLTVAAAATPTNPVAKLMVADETDEDETLAVFKLTANVVEDIEVDDILFRVTNGTRVSSYKFLVDGVVVATATGSNTPTAYFDDGELVVSSGKSKNLEVRANLHDINPTSTTDTTNQDVSITVNIDNIDDVSATGQASGSAATISGTASGNSHVAFESYPKFSVASNSPSGDLTNISSSALVAIFNVTAVGSEDIYFDSDNIITFDIDMTATSSDTTDDTWTLKDGDGNTLSTITVDSGNSDSANYQEAAFVFEDNTLTVPTGQTKALYVYGDTREFEANGDSLRVWLDDNSATNDFEWDIDNDTGEYEHPDIIFRGDIFANALTNPS